MPKMESAMMTSIETALTTTNPRLEPAIELHGVTHGFSETVLDDLDLVVPRGQFICLVGASGCGKTTVLNMLAGLIPPQSGDVRVLGTTPRGARRSIGYMFARDALLPWRTAIRNVELGLEFRGTPRIERREIALRNLERVGLGKHAHKYVWQLSQGMRQRVALARTWATDPDLLLMDEPFAALDVQTRLSLESAFLDIWEASGKTAVFVTHDLSEAIALADRVVLLGHGRILADIDVPFARPRELVKLSARPEFQDIYQELWGLIG
jgi:NitT/TauT family transport system ATP-binding protein